MLLDGASGLGSWSWNVATGELWLSPAAQDIFGPGRLDGTFSTWLRGLDAVDAKALQKVEEQLRQGQRTFSFEYRFTRADGVSRWLKSDGEVASVDARGEPVTIAGTVIDLGRPEALEPPRSRREGAPGGAADVQDTLFWEQDASFRFTRLQGGADLPAAALAQGVGLRRWELPHAVPLNCSWQQHIAALQRHEPLRGFEYAVGSGANTAYVSSSGDPVFDADGAFRGYRGTAHNITRRVRAEQSAGQVRILLQQASKLGHLGAWALRVPEMEVEWTDESRSIFGCPTGAALRWDSALAQVEEPFRGELARRVVDCVAQGKGFSLDARMRTPAGDTRWLRFIGEAEPAVTGPCCRVVGAVQDISDRKEDERRLQELNDRLVSTLESITEGFYTLDREWRFTYVNHVTEEVAKRPRSELLGQPIAQMFPWFVGSQLQEEYERALAQGRSAHFETFCEALDLWVEVYAYPSAQGLAIYFQDITQRKKAQTALLESEERHRLLVEASLDAIVQVEHASGRIISANGAACEMFRLSPEQLRERGRNGFVAPGEQALEALLGEVEASGRARGQLTLLRGDGTQFQAEISGATFRGSDGVTYGSVVIRDMSEVLKYRAEILALNESLARKVRERTAELEAANAELKAFARSLAHDLRTPIAAVKALGHALEERLPEAAQRERDYAGKITRAAQQLGDYVEALLSQARISQAPMRHSRVDLSSTAHSILEDLRFGDPQRQVVAEVQPGLYAYGDPALLRMALENLLGNAWKFTAYRADAQIRFTATEQREGWTTLCVSDNGAGFAMEQGHKLFSPFQRLHPQAEFAGTGIGLANVQRIVARHGGRIWAVGHKGAGAAFFFTLQQDAPPAGRAHGMDSP